MTPIIADLEGNQPHNQFCTRFFLFSLSLEQEWVQDMYVHKFAGDICEKQVPVLTQMEQIELFQNAPDILQKKKNIF